MRPTNWSSASLSRKPRSRSSMIRSALLVLTLGIGAAFAAAAQNDFVSTWKADGVTQIDFAGKKVAAVLIVDDDSLRVPTEEALAKEITAREIGRASCRERV